MAAGSRATALGTAGKGFLSILAAPALAFFGAYHQAVKRRPYTLNALTSGLTMCVGDRLAQHIEGKRAAEEGKAGPPAWESAARTGILVFWSSCVSSPWWTWWYTWLNARFPARVFVAVGLTAAIPAPFWNAAFFVFSTGAEHAVLGSESMGDTGGSSCSGA